MNSANTFPTNAKRHHPSFKHGNNESRLGVAIIVAAAFLTASPLITLFFLASGDSRDTWSHLISYVLTSSVLVTGTLLSGVAIVTILIGSSTAWILTRYQFPLSGVLRWALVLPLATPTYLAAYTWVEFADFTGPLQELVRRFGDFESSREYWFPDLRSTGGAIFLLSIVLFPYVYLPARLSFKAQSGSMLDVARVLGAGPFKLFFKIALPAARPAIAIGALLAIMETLNDIGAVEHLGVRTITFSVFDTWLNRSSLAGAAQLSLLLLAFVGLLVFLENWLRRQKAFYEPRNGAKQLERQRLSSAKGWLACFYCLLPVILGFVIPVGQMIKFTLIYPEQISEAKLFDVSLNSVLVAVGTAVICILIGFFFVHVRQNHSSNYVRRSIALASFGYAIPGTVLAIGVLTMMSGVDNSLSRLWAVATGERLGLIASGSIFIIIFACSIRFITIAIGNIEAGYLRLSPSLVRAARTLGRSHRQTIFQIELPLLAKTLATAALLVMVETMKELSATMLLRPFNFDTLATHVYSLASRALFEQAAFAALLIVMIGLVPVYLLSIMLDRGDA